MLSALCLLVVALVTSQPVSVSASSCVCTRWGMDSDCNTECIDAYHRCAANNWVGVYEGEYISEECLQLQLRGVTGCDQDYCNYCEKWIGC